MRVRRGESGGEQKKVENRGKDEGDGFGGIMAGYGRI